MKGFLLVLMLGTSACHINGCWNNDFDHDYVEPESDAGAPDGECGRCADRDSGPDVGNPNVDITIDSFTGSPHGIAAIDGDVFVIEGDQLVMLAPNDGGYVAMTIATGIGPAAGLVSDGDWLYWSSVPIDAGTTAITRLRVRPMIGVPEPIATGSLPMIEGIAVVDGGVRWLDAKKGLVTADSDGGELVLVNASVMPTGVFSAVVHANGSTQFTATDEVMTMDDDGGVTSSAVLSPLAIAVDATRRYVARRTSTKIEIGLLLDGGFSPVAYSFGCRAMVLGDDLYVADDMSNKIFKIRPNGTDWAWAWPSGSPHDLALDSQYLYYTASGSTSEVHRVTR